MFSPNDEYLSYYKSNTSCSYSKYDLINPAHGEDRLDYKDVQYYFYDDSFTKLDWKEPKESIDTLYKLRAEQLRDKYSKIVLEVCNIDGINTLVSFLKNNISVDEVFLYYTRGDTRSQYNNEIRINIVPKIQELQKHFNFYFRPIECDGYFIDKMWNEWAKDLLPWLENGPWTGNGLIHKNLLELVPEYDGEKNLGVIFSNGKPFVFPKLNVFRFCDILNPIHFIKDICPYSNEDFYWYPSSKIVIKQAHLVNQWANKNKNYMNMVVPHEQNKYDYVPLSLTNKTIYPDIKASTFQHFTSMTRSKYDIKTRCGISNAYSPQSWLYFENYSIKDVLLDTMKTLEKTVDSCWLEGKDIYDGLKPIWSRDYNLM